MNSYFPTIELYVAPPFFPSSKKVKPVLPAYLQQSLQILQGLHVPEQEKRQARG